MSYQKYDNIYLCILTQFIGKNDTKDTTSGDMTDAPADGGNPQNGTGMFSSTCSKQFKTTDHFDSLLWNKSIFLL